MNYKVLLFLFTIACYNIYSIELLDEFNIDQVDSSGTSQIVANDVFIAYSYLGNIYISSRDHIMFERIKFFDPSRIVCLDLNEDSILLTTVSSDFTNSDIFEYNIRGKQIIHISKEIIQIDNTFSDNFINAHYDGNKILFQAKDTTDPNYIRTLRFDRKEMSIDEVVSDVQLFLLDYNSKISNAILFYPTKNFPNISIMEKEIRDIQMNIFFMNAIFLNENLLLLFAFNQVTLFNLDTHIAESVEQFSGFNVIDAYFSNNQLCLLIEKRDGTGVIKIFDFFDYK